jgi:hypothetical protein
MADWTAGFFSFAITRIALTTLHTEKDSPNATARFESRLDLSWAFI